ncbi:hypothetical protein FM21_30290 [Streptomyces mutabilis]|uniref:Ketoreductase domain-containing protein n=1 Tax=Streptomyces mutabilis TaxID=67332 RepID=A0A086MU65_9ACTN|nr:hypothetical protein FM21_30290 [Streptomyces mutabilis]
MTIPDDLHLFTEDWEEAPAVPAPAPRPSGCTVVFLSDPHLQQEVRRRLLADEPGQAVVTVGRGAAGLRRLADDRYEIGGEADTELREAYTTLLRTVTAGHGPVGTVVHLWATEDRGLLREPDAVVTLLQTLVREETAPRRVVLGAAFDDATERCAAESWLGFERSAGIVMPGTRLTVLLSDGVGHRSAWAELLAAELRAEDPVGALYSGGRRHVQRVRVAAPEPGAADRDPLRRGGTYLITGGTGGLGRIFGTWLAREYAARLVLVGRRPQDEPVERLLADLTAAGATAALYCQADVCDATALTAAVDTAVARFGRIDGVLHAAGVERSGNISTRDLAVFRSVLGPKVSGTLNLETALKGRAPEFVVYFSSSAAVLGDFGGCDYACGNRFQMSLARHLAASEPSGPRRLAVNWPLWNSDGMNFADDTAKEFYLRSSGQRFLEPDEGTALLRELLGRTGPQYLALAGRAERVRTMLKAEDPLPAPAGPAEPGQEGPAARQRRGESRNARSPRSWSRSSRPSSARSCASPWNGSPSTRTSRSSASTRSASWSSRESSPSCSASTSPPTCSSATPPCAACMPSCSTGTASSWRTATAPWPRRPPPGPGPRASRPARRPRATPGRPHPRAAPGGPPAAASPRPRRAVAAPPVPTSRSPSSV